MMDKAIDVTGNYEWYKDNHFVPISILADEFNVSKTTMRYHVEKGHFPEGAVLRWGKRIFTTRRATAKALRLL